MNKKKILIVVDMQKDFVDGSLGSKEAQSIVGNVVDKIKSYKNHNLPIFITYDTHYDDYMTTLEGKKLPIPHCITGTKGSELTERVEEAIASYPDVNFIFKNTFGYSSWRKAISKVQFATCDEDMEFELCGLCTDICVVSNALILRAIYPNSKITIDASCCAGVTPEKHAAALEVLKSCQMEVINE